MGGGGIGGVRVGMGLQVERVRGGGWAVLGIDMN